MTPASYHVLVVDDEPANLRFVGNLLKNEGYQIHVADSGELALEIAGEIPLDLILLDIRMPRGLDGLETCRRLKGRETTRHLPVIFLTGRDDEETMVSAFEAGGADYVLKPFDGRVLLARVRTHTQLGLLSRHLEAALAERTRELRTANDKLRCLAMEIALIEERERKRLAGELHDSPMQKLALAQMQIASAIRSRDEEADQLFETGLALMREALQELRSVQFQLSPPVLYQEGLAAALAWLAAHATQRWGVPTEFAVLGAVPALPQALAVVLFQVARELVLNLVKHAHATQGRIELRADEGEVALTVEDDGRGFRPKDPGPSPGEHGGYGLFSANERLALLGGELQIVSGSGGTRARIRVPLAHGEAQMGSARCGWEAPGRDVEAPTT